MARKRNTRQREILQMKLEKIDTFFNAEDLLKEAREEYEGIGIATVYRFLNGLKKRNQIYSYKCDRKTVFSKDNKSHCHFICESTGKLVHFNIDSLDFLKDKIPGSIISFQLEVRGRCKDKCKKCSKDYANGGTSK